MKAISDPATWTLDPETWSLALTAEERSELECGEFFANEVRHGRAERLLGEADLYGCSRRLDAVIDALDSLDPELLNPKFYRTALLLQKRLSAERKQERKAIEAAERDPLIWRRYWEIYLGGYPKPWDVSDWRGRKTVTYRDVALAEVMAEFGIGLETARRIVREGGRPDFLDDGDNSERSAQG